MEKRFEIPVEVYNEIVELLDRGMGENFVPVNVTLLDDNTSEVVENNVKAYLCNTNMGNQFYYLVDSQKIRAAGIHTKVDGPRLSGTRVSDFAAMMIVLAFRGFGPEFVNHMIMTDDPGWCHKASQFINDVWKITHEAIVNLARTGTLNPRVGGATPQH